MFTDTRTIGPRYNLTRLDHRRAFVAALDAHPNDLRAAVTVRTTEFSVIVTTADGHAAHAVQILGNRAAGSKPVKYAQRDSTGTFTVTVRF